MLSVSELLPPHESVLNVCNFRFRLAFQISINSVFAINSIPRTGIAFANVCRFQMYGVPLPTAPTLFISEYRIQPEIKRIPPRENISINLIRNSDFPISMRSYFVSAP